MDFSYISGRNIKWYTHFGKQFSSFFIKVNTYLSYNTVLPILDIYLKAEISKLFVRGPKVNILVITHHNVLLQLFNFAIITQKQPQTIHKQMGTLMSQ